ncbi:CaiB/BaiF CoA transferase family protein [Rhodococcus sp. OK302]|uniref:CaiB/BaiF CoA transferase family protein n=1 Tax=Rhodococcus sp. OK302 TaxID=1882769 RepID=UPI000B9417B1|nr:CoA transferase [Rhodococcus sp. OK302]OYD61481.1 crotonobetainyl-CoA:carnitine CoA-transferase CaiB-like acyl-CoA transferase [Rhodococcus sp. OK302]
MTGPLSGFTVIDLTRALSGPYATLLLGGLGATVIKIEEPSAGDVARGNVPYLGRDGINRLRHHSDDLSIPFLERCRGKLGVTLNLKHPDAIEVFDDLIREADIVVENFSAGTADRLGIGYDHARSINPRIVYTSINGFGSDAAADTGKAYDLTIQALSGLAMTSGLQGDDAVRVGLPLGDMMAPLFAVAGTLAAVLEAKTSGIGQHVDVSMLGALTSMVAVEPWGGYSETGMSPRTGNYLNRLAPFGIFQALDGEVAICAANDGFFKRLPAAMGMPELLSDSRFSERAPRAANAEEIHRIVAEWAAVRGVDEIEKCLYDADIPVSRVRTPEEAVCDPHVLGRGETVALAHPDYGEAEGLYGSGIPIIFSETPAEFSGPAPHLGQHNDRVYTEILGYDDERLASMRERGLV